MKTLKEYEDDLYEKFCTGEKLNIGKLQDFYRQAINEILEEVVGEDKVKGQIEGYPADEMYILEDGYNQAKAEIRANAAKVLGK